jgi:hypothetical protein
VQLRPGPGGHFAGQANATNSSASYLNDRRVTWSIVDAHGARLERGSARIASLAPAATTTISLTGSHRFRASWRAVRFVLEPRGAG